MIGRTFGKWTVIAGASDSNKGEQRWLCRCKCGKEAVCLADRLLSGYSHRCQACAQKGKKIYKPREEHYSKRSSSYDRNDDLDAPDIRDSAEYQTLYKRISKIVARYCRLFGRIKENDLARKYPEARGHIKGILSMLEFEHKIRATHHALISHYELVPEKERELELARRKAKEETLHSSSANTMLFVESTARREAA